MTLCSFEEASAKMKETKGEKKRWRKAGRGKQRDREMRRGRQEVRTGQVLTCLLRILFFFN